MNKAKKLLFALLVAVLTVAAVPAIQSGYNGTSDVYAASKSKVKINKTKATLVKGGSTLKLKISGTRKKVTWKSSKPSVAKVSKKGVVTAKKKGTATITAKVGSKKLKCKVKVEEPKLTSKTTINTGALKTLKVSGTTLKVTWKSSNTGIVKVSKKGKIVGVKPGTATVTATVATKKLKCNVTVKDPDPTKKITYKVIGKYKNDLYVSVTNNNSIPVNFEFDAVYYDTKGNMLSKGYGYNYCLGPNSTSLVNVTGPYDKSFNKINYAKYKLILKAQKSYYKSFSNKITVNANVTDEGAMAEIKNTSSTTLSTVKLMFVFYDSNNKIISFYDTYAFDCKAPGSVEYKEVPCYSGNSYTTVTPAKCDVYVNHAYNYNVKP